jgi:hypothetical protein
MYICHNIYERKIYTMFKNIRKKLKLDNKELLSFIGKKSSIIYYIENNYQKKSIIKYVIFLRLKGVNLNKFFDEMIQNDFPDIDKKKPTL